MIVIRIGPRTAALLGMALTAARVALASRRAAR